MLKPKEQQIVEEEDGMPVLTEDQFLSRYRLVRTIGQGEFAKVKLAEDVRSGHKVDQSLNDITFLRPCIGGHKVH